ncbi:hypothetical protein L198_07049 [Cryptococcus wingfieldii CBS 7118]|uniref:Uncharacterized protein n=1 Tax=Cryptococcus wingfieldii CBS 7118 TaxID=1295528 RepID=A0A1E3IFN2_9TREE|nr:hypothetical protein L198_07049 [Cryptococcus wingfieldii CBS 7118]ODN87424.1 hypothetical protein L198_07049 [Cryptococcus wingfieldii CBS 7118]
MPVIFPNRSGAHRGFRHSFFSSDHASNTVYSSFIISKMIGNAQTILDQMSMPETTVLLSLEDTKLDSITA